MKTISYMLIGVLLCCLSVMLSCKKKDKEKGEEEATTQFYTADREVVFREDFNKKGDWVFSVDEDSIIHNCPYRTNIKNATHKIDNGKLILIASDTDTSSISKGLKVRNLRARLQLPNLALDSEYGIELGAVSFKPGFHDINWYFNYATMEFQMNDLKLDITHEFISDNRFDVVNSSFHLLIKNGKVETLVVNNVSYDRNSNYPPFEMRGLISPINYIEFSVDVFCINELEEAKSGELEIDFVEIYNIK